MSIEKLQGMRECFDMLMDDCKMYRESGQLDRAMIAFKYAERIHGMMIGVKEQNTFTQVLESIQ